MPASLATDRAIHLSADPDASALLAAELRDVGLDLAVTRVASRRALDQAIDATGARIVIADLPLPFDDAQVLLAELALRSPELPVVFRWGGPGNWSVEGPGDQLGRAVSRALDPSAPAPAAAPGHHLLLERVARWQEAVLRLQQLDYWDWDRTIEATTRVLADLLDVDRVSVWELEADGERLRCTDLFERSRQDHTRGQALAAPPRYRDALESCLSIATEDARTDPRTREFADGYLIPLGITSMIDAPVRRDGRIVGVVCAEHIGPPRAWTLVDRCGVASVATHVSNALAVRERRAIEERLREIDRGEAAGRLGALLAHDVNNALTTIVGQAELALHQASAADPARKALEVIASAAEHATAVVRGLLTATRSAVAEPEAMDLCREVVALQPVVAAILGARSRVSVFTDEGPHPVVADPTHLRQVVFNLATNARDAMPHGGVFTMAVERTHADEGDPLVSPGAYVVLKVTDNGVGMDEHVRARAFEPFFTTKPPGVGTGLGLSSVASLVRDMGGAVSVTSAPKRGTRFEILIPEA